MGDEIWAEFIKATRVVGGLILFISALPLLIRGCEKINQYIEKRNSTPKVWIYEDRNVIRSSPSLLSANLRGYDYDKDGFIDEAKGRWNMGPRIPLGGWEEIDREDYKFKALQREYHTYLTNREN